MLPKKNISTGSDKVEPQEEFNRNQAASEELTEAVKEQIELAQAAKVTEYEGAADCGDPRELPAQITRGMGDGFNGGSFREKKVGKGMFHAIPAEALRRLAQRYEVGPLKYQLDTPHDWRKGFPQSSFMDSLFRHLADYMEGDNSEDHLAAIAWNAFGAMYNEKHHPEFQDIAERAGLPFDEYTKYWPYTDVLPEGGVK